MAEKSTTPNFVTAITNKLSDYLLVKDFQTTLSIKANNVITIVPSSFITVPDGYRLLGCVGLSFDNTYVRMVNFKITDFNSKYAITLFNDSSSDLSTPLKVSVLFVRK